jgi:hypothetical protein
MPHSDDSPARRQPKPKLRFGKAEEWRDSHGTHRRVCISFGDEVVGEILCDICVGSSPKYTIWIGGRPVGPTLRSMEQAKDYVRVHIGR